MYDTVKERFPGNLNVTYISSCSSPVSVNLPMANIFSRPAYRHTGDMVVELYRFQTSALQRGA
jgi:hypothetical protein